MTTAKRQLVLVMAMALVLDNMIGWLISAVGALWLAGVLYRLAQVVMLDPARLVSLRSDQP